MNQRSGATLMEVLVAIFVMSLGLMGLLVLFPLGALSMAQAIQDSRATVAAGNAAAIAEIQGIRNDPELQEHRVGPFLIPDAFSVLPYRLGDPPCVTAPNTPWPVLSSWRYPLISGQGWDGPSYPVFVDYFGTTIFDPAIDRLGESRPIGPPPFKSPGLSRRKPSFTVPDPQDPQPALTAFRQYLRWCTLLDDIEFKPTGLPTDLADTVVKRDIRYSWTYLVRRPRFWDRSVVDLVGVVYKGRPSVVRGERTYGRIKFDTTTTAVVVPWNPAEGQEKPPIRVGSWILDGTVVKPNLDPDPVRRNQYPYLPDPHGFFHRVVGVTEGPGVSEVTLELQTKPRMDTFAGTVNWGVLVVMENVVEVFEKGPGWLP